MHPNHRMSTPRITPRCFPGHGAPWLWLTVLLLFVGACTPIPTSAPDDGSASPSAPSDAQALPAAEPCQDPDVPWSYSGDNGPKRWASLSPCFALCDAGQAQSPVAVTPGAAGTLPPLRFQYQEAPLRITNTGNMVQLELDGTSSLDFGEMTFGLRQVQMHAPSEHTLRGREYPMELQFVHSARDSLTVVAVFVEAGEDNPALATLWDHLPQDVTDTRTIEGVRWQPSELLPESPATHRYPGSLTTPPCSENVRWIVMDEPITLSQEKIDAFRALFEGNRRPLQDLGDREVLSDG